MAKLAIDALIAPLCIGQDATRIGSLMLHVQKKLHVFGRSGALFYGISAIDIALWDIAGKAAGVPVCRLLGSARTADLNCYASLIRYSDPSFVRANVRRAIDSGFHILKIAAGENSSTLMDFERRLAAEAVDFVQPSIAKMGGISQLRQIFPIAAVRNVTVMPHCFMTGRVCWLISTQRLLWGQRMQ